MVNRDGDCEEVGAVPGAVQAGLEIGATIAGRYRVVGQLGRGGMGEVIEVEHLELGRTFALKALRRELVREPRVTQRFRAEWTAMASIRSEHVVAIVDTGTLASGVPYFVMERLRGDDLRTLLADGRKLPPVRVAELGIDACYGLTALHAAGLVHRDLKPENLFVTQGDDGRDVLKVLDLGVAKVLGENATAPGAVVGTARYMAPEQLGEDGAVGPAADIFALGVILYEALVGRTPFDGDTFERVLFKIMTEEPEPLARLCPEAPLPLVEAVERALAKTPAERHASAAAFASALARAVASSRARATTGSSPVPSTRAAVERRETTLDEAQSPVAVARPSRAAPSRAAFGMAVVAAAGVGFALAVALRPSASAEEGAPPLPGPVPSVAAPATAPVVVDSAVPEVAAELERPPGTSAPPPPPASSSGSRPIRRTPSGTPAPSSDPPRVAFDPENPYAK